MASAEGSVARSWCIANGCRVLNAPCWIRTNDRLLRRQLLYPAELREQGPVGHRRHCASADGKAPYSGLLRRSRPMAATRLTDSQKSELVARYSAGEGSGELAAAFGCSVNTVSRVVKAALSPDDYERLKQERARGARNSSPTVTTPAPELAQVPVAVAVVEASGTDEPSAPPQFEAAQDPESSGETEPESSGDAEEDDEADGTLAIDDADDFGDDSTEDDGDDADGSDDALELPVAAATQEPVSCIPIADADLPASVYMLVEKTVELEARPLGEFTELGLLPPGEEERQALQVFVNPRNAKRLCGRNQRVIKIPDTRIFERTARYLVAQGISRLVIENGVYSLPGA